MKGITKYIKNEAKDGVMPVCPYCGETYPDACYGEVKNYPDDGGLAVFMQCENCGEESEVWFEWSRVDKNMARRGK